MLLPVKEVSFYPLKADQPPPGLRQAAVNRLTQDHACKKHEQPDHVDHSQMIRPLGRNKLGAPSDGKILTKVTYIHLWVYFFGGRPVYRTTVCCKRSGSGFLGLDTTDERTGAYIRVEMHLITRRLFRFPVRLERHVMLRVLVSCIAKLMTH